MFSTVASQRLCIHKRGDQKEGSDDFHGCQCFALFDEIVMTAFREEDAGGLERGDVLDKIERSQTFRVRKASSGETHMYLSLY